MRMLERCYGGRITDCLVIKVVADHTRGSCPSQDHEASVQVGERLANMSRSPPIKP